MLQFNLSKLLISLMYHNLEQRELTHHVRLEHLWNWIRKLHWALKCSQETLISILCCTTRELIFTCPVVCHQTMLLSPIQLAHAVVSALAWDPLTLKALNSNKIMLRIPTDFNYQSNKHPTNSRSIQQINWTDTTEP